MIDQGTQPYPASGEAEVALARYWFYRWFVAASAVAVVVMLVIAVRAVIHGEAGLLLLAGGVAALAVVLTMQVRGDVLRTCRDAGIDDPARVLHEVRRNRHHVRGDA